MGLHCTVGQYFDVYLRTRKSSQTGITHGWRLWMNDSDPKICPLRALIRLAVLYGDSGRLSGPLFLKIDTKGAVLHEGLVCYFLFTCIIFLIFLFAV